MRVFEATCRHLILSAVFLILPCVSGAQELPLLRNPSPSVVQPGNYSVALSGGYETGAIPTTVISAHLDAGILRNLQGRLGLTFASFDVRDEDRRLSGLDGELRYRLPDLPGMDSVERDARLFAFAGVAYAPGEAVTTPYERNLRQVHTAVAEHGDPGLDLFCGVLGTSGPFFEHDLIHVGLSAEYARTLKRDYYPSLAEEGSRNRVQLNVFPFLFSNLGTMDVSVALQNRYTHWFDRGSMLELMPQVSLVPNDRFVIVTGASLPAVGGGVFKFVVELRYRFETPGNREVRIQVRDLHFPPNQAMLFGPENEHSERNRRRIENLYQSLSAYPEYSVIVEGHTSWVHWDDPVRGPAEQERVLIPLSRARAAAVAAALVDLGLPDSRIRSVGRGGDQPDVPFDHPEQWRNRRVEIVLVRQ